MRILITGATGFIGGHLLKRLIKDHEITMTAQPNEAVLCRSGLKVVSYYDTVPECYDLVFHQAADNDTLSEDRVSMFQTNYYTPQVIIEQAIAYGCKKIVYASSTAVYGKSPIPYSAKITKPNPLNCYAESKLAFDQWIMDLKYDVDIIGLRYCNVYGPGEQLKGRRMSMVGQILRRALKGEAIKLFDPGTQERDWVYVEDVVNANILAAMQGKGKQIYDIGTGQKTSFNEIVDIVSNVLGKKQVVDWISNPHAAAYQDQTQCDISNSKLDIGYSPEYSIRSGIVDYIYHLSGVHQRAKPHG